MGPLLEIRVDEEAVITLPSKCLNATASIVYFSVSCKTLADGSFSFPLKPASDCVSPHARVHTCVDYFSSKEIISLRQFVCTLCQKPFTKLVNGNVFVLVCLCWFELRTFFFSHPILYRQSNRTTVHSHDWIQTLVVRPDPPLLDPRSQIILTKFRKV